MTEIVCKRTNPRAITPNVEPGIGPNPSPETSLVEGLGSTVDELRQLYTDFGLRPYRLVSVVGRWSGGERGRGEWVVVSQEELLPTPKVRVMTDSPGSVGRIAETANSVGVTERGPLLVTEISPLYTEDDVAQLFHCQPDLPPGFEGFIEMQIDRRDGEPERRRFTTDQIPARDAGGFQWTVQLTSMDQARSRRGVFPNLGRGT